MCRVLTIRHLCGHTATVPTAPCPFFEAYSLPLDSPLDCPYKQSIRGGDDQLCWLCEAELGRVWLERLGDRRTGCGWGIWEWSGEGGHNGKMGLAPVRPNDGKVKGREMPLLSQDEEGTWF